MQTLPTVAAATLKTDETALSRLSFEIFILLNKTIERWFDDSFLDSFGFNS